MISRRTGTLTGNTSVGGCYVVSRQEAGAYSLCFAAAGSQRVRIIFAIDFAVGIGSPGRVPLVNRQLGTHIDDVVVLERGRRRSGQRGSDVISRWTGILTGNTAIGGRDVISRQEPGA